MAKNWTISEVTGELTKENKNKENLMDIGKRFPLLTVVLTAALAGNEKALVQFLDALPGDVTANKVNARLKDGAEEAEDNEDVGSEEVEEKQEKTAKENKKKESKDSGVKDYESMGAYPLYKLCKERGLDVKSKQPKNVYIEALKAADGAGSESEAEDDWDEGSEGQNYEDMKPKDLFDECKARGLKVEAKKSADYYIKKLKEDDAKSEAEGEGEDDWDEEEAPKENKSKGKKDKKDDEDEWDI